MKKFTSPLVFDFDTNTIKLKEVICEIFAENDIQKIIEKNSNETIYKALYSSVNEKKFQTNYNLLIKKISKLLKIKSFFFQKIPSFRIHRKNNISVYYHNDIWYGHGKNVLNIWIPFIKTNNDNTIWIVKEKDSIKLGNDFVKRKLSIKEMNILSKNSGHPQIVKYGNILVFKASWLHGSEQNNSKQHRLSFDFRILPKGKSPGTKPINEFYLPFHKIKRKIKECYYFIYKKNLFLNYLSHVSQREIINSYCIENNMVVKQEETEIHGVDHYPNLDFFLTNNLKKIPIVFTSIFCFPPDYKLRKFFFNLADKNGIELHFALENICYPKISYTKINSYYRNYNKLYNHLKKSK